MEQQTSRRVKVISTAAAERPAADGEFCRSVWFRRTIRPKVPFNWLTHYFLRPPPGPSIPSGEGGQFRVPPVRSPRPRHVRKTTTTPPRPTFERGSHDPG